MCRAIYLFKKSAPTQGVSLMMLVEAIPASSRSHTLLSATSYLPLVADTPYLCISTQTDPPLPFNSKDCNLNRYFILFYFITS